MAAAAAIPLVTKLASSIAKVIGGLLGQHTARLKGAANENQALDACIPAFDADLKEIADAYNSGQASAKECIEALQNVDAQTYSYLRAQVGKPGTKWGGPSNLGSQMNPSFQAVCNKACTAGCCVYLNDLRPAIYGAGGPHWPDPQGGMIEAIQNNGGIVNVPKIYPPPNKAYGNFERAGYKITITKPKLTTSALSKIQKTLGGHSVLENLGVHAPTVQDATSGIASDIESSFSGSGNLLLIGGVLLGALLIVNLARS